MNPFEFMNQINYGKNTDFMNIDNEKYYNSFLINRKLGDFQDTVLLANIMNQFHQIDKRCQFDFLLNSIRKRKRFSKKVATDEISDIDIIKEYYGYSNEKARQALTILSKDDIEEIKIKVSKGGVGRAR